MIDPSSSEWIRDWSALSFPKRSLFIGEERIVYLVELIKIFLIGGFSISHFRARAHFNFDEDALIARTIAPIKHQNQNPRQKRRENVYHLRNCLPLHARTKNVVARIVENRRRVLSIKARRLGLIQFFCCETEIIISLNHIPHPTSTRRLLFPRSFQTKQYTTHTNRKQKGVKGDYPDDRRQRRRRVLWTTVHNKQICHTMASKNGSFLRKSDRQKILRDLDQKGELELAPESVRTEAAEATILLQSYNSQTNGNGNGHYNHNNNNNNNNKTRIHIEEETFGTGCLCCGADDDHANLLLCEACNAEYHTYVTWHDMPWHAMSWHDMTWWCCATKPSGRIKSNRIHRYTNDDCIHHRSFILVVLDIGYYLPIGLWRSQYQPNETLMMRLSSLCFSCRLCGNAFFLSSIRFLWFDRYCLEPPLRAVPTGDWFCGKQCKFFPCSSIWFDLNWFSCHGTNMHYLSLHKHSLYYNYLFPS